MRLTEEKKIELLKKQNKYKEIFKEVSSYSNEDKKIADEVVGQKQLDNKKLFRRWITAQTFSLLDGPDGLSKENWERHMKDFSDKYQFSMMQEELRVLSILQKKDKEAFKERKCFFNQEVCIALCMHAFKKGMAKQGTAEIFEALVNAEEDYSKISGLFKQFRKEMYVFQPKEKCSEWLDAYRNAGSYETIKNLVLFHGCKMKGLTGEAAMEKLAFIAYNNAVSDWQALLLEVIEENNFDYKKAW